MKSAMPYHGVPSPILKKTCKALFSELEFKTAREWQTTVLHLWENAKFREERYAALQLTYHKTARPFQKPEALKLYENLIVTGAWWDYVDDIAAHRVGPLLVDYPKEIGAKMLKWSTSDNMWKRRTSIICQLMAKEHLDLDLLYRCIEPSIDSKEFFLRKAIGWALRQIAWDNPQEILRYVKKNEARLSALSKREALKNIS